MKTQGIQWILTREAFGFDVFTAESLLNSVHKTRSNLQVVNAENCKKIGDLESVVMLYKLVSRVDQSDADLPDSSSMHSKNCMKASVPAGSRSSIDEPLLYLVIN